MQRVFSVSLSFDVHDVMHRVWYWWNSDTHLITFQFCLTVPAELKVWDFVRRL